MSNTLNNHKINSIKSSIFSIELFTKFFEFLYDPQIKDIMVSKSELKNIRSEGINKLILWLENMANSKNDYISVQLKWWENAKTMKVNGFYVGFKKGKWYKPSSIKKPHYIQTKKYVGDFLSRVEVFNNINFNEEPIPDILFLIKSKIIKHV